MSDSWALFTDLYEMKMLQAYFREGMTDEAVFSLFVRRLPRRRNYLLACGIDTVLDYVETFKFREDDLAYLASLGTFEDAFLEQLRHLRFTGDIYAVPEGTPVFANEPIVEVMAPLPEAQIVETFLMNQVHAQTILATKARRVVTAAAGRPVYDFGMRRMHGIDTALKAARAFHIGGVTGTSNVLAGKQLGISVAGTMAHSYIQAHKDEASAFRAFADLYPETVLLVDTYDTLEGVKKVIALAEERGEAFRVSAVRLDSGDLLELSRGARAMLDEAGLDAVKIFASGGLDEDSMANLLAAGAPIDAFGVGTSMGVSSDAPDLDTAYKLCEYGGKGRVKLSASKPVLPGRKQIFRISDNGRDVGDIIARTDESLPGRPLLVQVMRKGERLPAGRVDLESARRYAGEQVARLPDHVLALSKARPPYPVTVSRELSGYHKKIKDEIYTRLSRVE